MSEYRDSKHASAEEGDELWLNLLDLARVQITSEAPGYPATAAFSPNPETEWRAKEPGPQTIRVIFGLPQSLRRIQLQFSEREVERTQEFVVKWRPEGSSELRELLRQQYTFSPHGSRCEVEDYSVNLEKVVVIEIVITPDISGRDAVASLTRWRIG
jgi:hypothetical protein